MAYSGLFKPAHPEKYVGDVSNIVWRSSWERGFFKYCDDTPGVLRWSSEELVIPYVSPVDGRIHRYFPDVWMRVQSSTGIKEYLVEIKPKRQATMPKAPKRKTRKYIAEVATVAVNQAKWQAAKEFCQKQGWTFLVLTEDELFKKK